MGELIRYVVVAFSVTFVLVTPIVTKHQGWTAVGLDHSWHFLGALGPLAGAVVVARRNSALKRQLRAGLSRWRKSWWLYAIALSPILLLLPAAAVVATSEGAWPAPELLTSSSRLGGLNWIMALAVPAVCYSLFEEVGWRGTALPKLEERFSRFGATTVLGLIWVVWHIPFYFYRQGMVDAWGAELFAHATVIMLGNFLLAWLYYRGGRSILLCVVWHFCNSVAHIVAPEFSRQLDEILGALVAVLCIALVVSWRWTLRHNSSRLQD